MQFRNYYLTVLAVLMAACGNQQDMHDTVPQYPVMSVCKSTIELSESYPATMTGRQDVEIYPQVSGTISRLCVKEGEQVRKGQTLFIIDQVPYQAALRTATANVRAAEAQVDVAQLDYNSKVILFNEEVISEYDLAMAKNTLSIAKAGLEQAKAMEVNARNDLSYTEVKSPANGVVGTLPYRAGALVSPSIPQPLTTVSDTEQMYVYFSMTESDIRNLIRQYGSPDETIKSMPNITLQLNDGTVYEHQGRIETISGIINPQTGTASVRSVFPNEKRILFSGGIGNVVLPQSETDIIVIPQSITFEIQDKIFVYKVVDGKAVALEIKVAKQHDGKNYIVRKGLSVGDRIISEGVGLVQDGMDVSIKE